jgi:hypothetical protein
MTGHTSWEKIREDRRTKLLSKPAVEYTGGPVYDEDHDRYYPDLDSLVDARWDDGDSYEDAIVFACTVGPLKCPDLEEYVDERWGEEFEEWYGLDPKVQEILHNATIEVDKLAPEVWHADYSKRLEFNYDGYDENDKL